MAPGSVARWLTAAGAVVVAWLMFDALVSRLVFQPTPGLDLAPERFGARELWFDSEDGVRLHALYLARAGNDRALVFLHGNAGNASHRLPNALALHQLGVDVLLPDYRGYGKSEGHPDEAGVYRDARAALQQLLDRGIDPRRVVLFGRSLGGAIAVDLARGRPLGAVILEGTFTSLADVARGLMGPPAAWLLPGRFASDRKIDELESPLLMLHGDRDEVIPYELGRRLYEAAPQPKSFETIRGAGHNDTLQVGGDAYLERLRTFIDRYVEPRQPGSATDPG